MNWKRFIPRFTLKRMLIWITLFAIGLALFLQIESFHFYRNGWCWNVQVRRGEVVGLSEIDIWQRRESFSVTWKMTGDGHITTITENDVVVEIHTHYDTVCRVWTYGEGVKLYDETVVYPHRVDGRPSGVYYPPPPPPFNTAPATPSTIEE